jgi:hypothetical protein
MADHTTVHKISLSRPRLARIPSEERNFLFASCHLANELNILQKLALWSIANSSKGASPVEQAQVAQTLFLLRLLAGKIHEGHELLRKSYFGSGLSRTYDTLLCDEARSALASFKRYFHKRSNLVTRIRNAYGFHYSPERVGDALAGLPATESLHCYLADHFSNTLYYFAEVLATTAMLDAVTERTMRDLLDNTTTTARHLLTIVEGFLIAFRERFPDVMERGAATMELPLLPEFSKVSIPFFTTDPRSE